jgi:hypothetical protein
MKRTKKTVAIFYGSQTGTAEEYAQRLVLEARGSVASQLNPPTLHPLCTPPLGHPPQLSSPGGHYGRLAYTLSDTSHALRTCEVAATDIVHALTTHHIRVPHLASYSSMNARCISALLLAWSIFVHDAGMA